MGRWRRQMQQPLRPRAHRLPLAVLFAALWFAIPFTNGGSTRLDLVMGTIGAALHLVLWTWGPTARRRADEPDEAYRYDQDPPEGPFPIWVERRD